MWEVVCGRNLKPGDVIRTDLVDEEATVSWSWQPALYKEVLIIVLADYQETVERSIDCLVFRKLKPNH